MVVEQVLRLGAVGVAGVAPIHVNPGSVVFAPTAHHIVLEVRFRHVQRRVDLHLEDVFARPYVCDVDPLTVDVVAVGVPAAH